MKTHLVVRLLLLTQLLFSHAQGIRLGKGFASQEHQLAHENKVSQSITNSDGGEDTVHGIDGRHSSGKNRKLVAATISTTSTPNSKGENEGGDEGNNGKGTTNNGQDDREEENFEINPPSVSEHYPDIIDIAGMDYSPAKRKTPIHN